MELIPKAYVSGLFILPPQVPGGPSITADKINRIWAEVSPDFGYTTFQTNPDYSAVNFLGPSPEVGVVIQPPLVQVRDAIRMTAAQSAEAAETIFKTISKHLGIQQFFNLGVKHVYHAPAPGGDAEAFVLGRVLSKTEHDLGDLVMGGHIWGGVKFVTVINDAPYTLTIEPLRADNQMLFIDLDVQFPGEADLDKVRTRSHEAEAYLTKSVSSYLDGLT